MRKILYLLRLLLAKMIPIHTNPKAS